MKGFPISLMCLQTTKEMLFMPVKTMIVAYEDEQYVLSTNLNGNIIAMIVQYIRKFQCVHNSPPTVQ